MILLSVWFVIEIRLRMNTADDKHCAICNKVIEIRSVDQLEPHFTYCERYICLECHDRFRDWKTRDGGFRNDSKDGCN
jgi:hypothetical protein